MRPIVTYEDTPPLLLVTGDEDRSTQSRRRRAMSRALAAPGDLRVDLRGLHFADATLVLDLAMVARRLRAAGRAMLVVGAQPQIAKLIELTGLHRMPGVTIDLATA